MKLSDLFEASPKLSVLLTLIGYSKQGTDFEIKDEKENDEDEDEDEDASIYRANMIIGKSLGVKNLNKTLFYDSEDLMGAPEINGKDPWDMLQSSIKNSHNIYAISVYDDLYAGKIDGIPVVHQAGPSADYVVISKKNIYKLLTSLSKDALIKQLLIIYKLTGPKSIREIIKELKKIGISYPEFTSIEKSAK